MRQQRALFISRVSIKDLLAANAPRSTYLGRAAALEKQASLCDALFTWPALAESLREDAEACRQKARKQQK